MKISNHKKMFGIVFSTVVLVLVLSLLTPVLGMKNKSISTTTNTIGYGYGYGYCPTSNSPGFWKTITENCGFFTIHTFILPLCMFMHRWLFNY
jgi:hypothetical protein